MIQQLRQSFSLLYRNPTFGRVWFGRSVSLFGDAIALVALPWFVLQITGSGTATAGVLLSLQLPTIVTSLVIGTWIDRSQPRRIIMLDNGLRTLLFGLIPVLYWFGRLELWLLFSLTVLAGLLEPATTLGTRSILPGLVADEDLDAANMLWADPRRRLSLMLGRVSAGGCRDPFPAKRATRAFYLGIRLQGGRCGREAQVGGATRRAVVGGARFERTWRWLGIRASTRSNWKWPTPPDSQ